jgi:HAD domain in Swiss Army Knife RNA repair proteins
MKSPTLSKIEEWAAIRPQFGTDFVIVFLDFDGVLHPDPCLDATRLFENAPRLEQTLSDFPHVQLVLSTAWRQTGTYEQLLVLLPEALRARVIGVTPNFNEFPATAALVPYRRQAECMHWMRLNGMLDEAWLALDDRPSGFTPYSENLIACHPQSGFDVAVSARMRSALERHLQRGGRDIDLLIS